MKTFNLFCVFVGTLFVFVSVVHRNFNRKREIELIELRKNNKKLYSNVKTVKKEKVALQRKIDDIRKEKNDVREKLTVWRTKAVDCCPGEHGKLTTDRDGSKAVGEKEWRKAPIAKKTLPSWF